MPRGVESQASCPLAGAAVATLRLRKLGIQPNSPAAVRAAIPTPTATPRGPPRRSRIPSSGNAPPPALNRVRQLQSPLPRRHRSRAGRNTRAKPRCRAHASGVCVWTRYGRAFQLTDPAYGGSQARPRRRRRQRLQRPAVGPPRATRPRTGRPGKASIVAASRLPFPHYALIEQNCMYQFSLQTGEIASCSCAGPRTNLTRRLPTPPKLRRRSSPAQDPAWYQLRQPSCPEYRSRRLRSPLRGPGHRAQGWSGSCPPRLSAPPTIVGGLRSSPGRQTGGGSLRSRHVCLSPPIPPVGGFPPSRPPRGSGGWQPLSRSASARPGVARWVASSPPTTSGPPCPAPAHPARAHARSPRPDRRLIRLPPSIHRRLRVPAILGHTQKPRGKPQFRPILGFHRTPKSWYTGVQLRVAGTRKKGPVRCWNPPHRPRSQPD